MSNQPVRAAYSMWPHYNERLRTVIADLSAQDLATKSIGHAPRPESEQWPIWATVGHLACQRVFWLCDFLGEPGADTTPFTNAAYDCPGDDDLVNAMDAPALVAALDSTFAIVEGCLDNWTIEMLGEEIRRPDFGPDWAHTRGSVLQRVFSHDVYHCGELSQTLGAVGLPQIDLWD
ncbi:MAG TPA: DinB family protein [Acidimicrobiia bacterium]|nr:DinB family protein [Acidimicrobiia bacterium]